MSQKQKSSSAKKDAKAWWTRSPSTEESPLIIDEREFLADEGGALTVGARVKILYGVDDPKDHLNGETATVTQVG